MHNCLKGALSHTCSPEQSKSKKLFIGLQYLGCCLLLPLSWAQASNVIDLLVNSCNLLHSSGLNTTAGVSKCSTANGLTVLRDLLLARHGNGKCCHGMLSATSVCHTSLLLLLLTSNCMSCLSPYFATAIQTRLDRPCNWLELALDIRGGCNQRNQHNERRMP